MQIFADSSRISQSSALQAPKNDATSKNDLESFLNSLKSKGFEAAVVKFLQEKYEEVPFSSIDKILELVAQAFKEQQEEGQTSKITALKLKALIPTWNVRQLLSDVKEVASNYPETKDCAEELKKFDDFIKQFPFATQEGESAKTPGSTRSMVTRRA